MKCVFKKIFALLSMYLHLFSFTLRENARKANSSRMKSKDFPADLQLKEVNVDKSSPGEKSPSTSRLQKE